jgi:pyruvate dehydrogenase (quinone)
MIRPGQRLTGTGMMASMAPGLPFAIAGQLAYPDRQSVAIVGDGGFAMLMAEMTTAVQHNLPVKIIVLKNNSLAEVKFEQMAWQSFVRLRPLADRLRRLCPRLRRGEVSL